MALKVLRLDDFRVKQALQHDALHGKKRIARGVFSAIYEGSKPSTVYKVTTDQFGYWMLNCGCTAVKHKHFPRVVEDYQDIGEIRVNDTMFPIYMFEMERLQKLQPGTETRRIARMVSKQQRLSCDKIPMRGHMRVSEQVEDMVKCGTALPRSVKNALGQLANYCSNADQERAKLDMHLGNFMQRKNGELVITDPLMDYEAYQARADDYTS